jgi:hypothetical protein
MRTIALALGVALVTASSATAAFVVTSRNIKNGTIQLVDISPRAKDGLRGQRGPRGAQGAPGISSITEVSVTLTIAAGGTGGTVASCPTGLSPISGGYMGSGYLTTSGVILVYINRRSQQRGWEVAAKNTATVPLSVLVHAYCAPGIAGVA